MTEGNKTQIVVSSGQIDREFPFALETYFFRNSNRCEIFRWSVTAAMQVIKLFHMLIKLTAFCPLNQTEVNIGKYYLLNDPFPEIFDHATQSLFSSNKITIALKLSEGLCHTFWAKFFLHEFLMYFYQAILIKKYTWIVHLHALWRLFSTIQDFFMIQGWPNNGRKSMRSLEAPLTETNLPFGIACSFHLFLTIFEIFTRSSFASSQV